MGVSSLAVMANSLTLQFQKTVDISQSDVEHSHVPQTKQTQQQHCIKSSSSKHAQRSLL